MELITTLFTYAKVAFGLGFVIFLHELGHFLLAKWNGVRVEKFSIGFGPSLLEFTWGETVYALAILPLGGFVKMLGENPEENPDEPRSSDPRAYHNKSIGARMSIISAGVIMNFILGIICFSLVYSQGTIELRAKIGQVVPGSPAYLAGIKPRDEIMAIDDRRDIAFDDLSRKSSLSGSGQKLHLELKRPGQTEAKIVDVEPRRQKGQTAPIIGIRSGQSLMLVDASASIPYPFVPLPGMGTADSPAIGTVKRGDVITAVTLEGEPPISVNDQDVLVALLDRSRDKTMVITVERSAEDGAKRESVDLKLSPCHVMDLGFRVGFEPIVAVMPGSPAESAGFHAGDIIISVDEKEDVDPLKLPTYCRDKAGQAVTFAIKRGDATLTLTATPDATPVWLDILRVSDGGPDTNQEPLEIPGLGLAYATGRTVQAIDAGSPAAKSGLKVGDIINEVTLPTITIAGEKKPDKARKPVVVTLTGESPASLSSLFKVMQTWPGLSSVDIKVQGRADKISIALEPSPTWFYPERGLSFGPLTRVVLPQGFVNSLKRGWEETIDNITSIFAMFRGLGQGRVGSKGLAGLPRILGIASGAAEAGWVPLVQFLGMLSINLAVLNFLPIPPLDGGQMVFLIGEKLRGKPLPDAALWYFTVTGLVLVLSLMLFTVSQDLLLMTGLIK